MFSNPIKFENTGAIFNVIAFPSRIKRKICKGPQKVFKKVPKSCTTFSSISRGQTNTIKIEIPPPEKSFLKGANYSGHRKIGNIQTKVCTK